MKYIISIESPWFRSPEPGVKWNSAGAGISIKKAKTSLTVLSQCLIKQYTESIDFVVSYDKIKYEERELTMSIFVISVFNIHFQFRLYEQIRKQFSSNRMCTADRSNLLWNGDQMCVWKYYLTSSTASSLLTKASIPWKIVSFFAWKIFLRHTTATFIL